MRFIIVLSVSIAMLLAGFASAEEFHVTQTGAGADYSASQFNALTGDYSGDIFYFSGTFTTRIDIEGIHGTLGHPVVLDGYQDGDCYPIDAVCTSSALLKQGMRVGNRAHGPDYITIQDFRMTKDEDTSSCLEIYPLYQSSTDSGSIDHITIRRNYVYQTKGTMFYFRQGNYGTVEDNKFTNFGQDGTDATQGIDLAALDDFVFQGNVAGHDEENFPSGCISANIIEIHSTKRAILQYNDIYGAPNQDGIVPKEDDDNSDIIIRFNKIHDNLGNAKANGAEHAGKGIQSLNNKGHKNSNLYIYGNYIYHNQWYGILVGPSSDGIYIWSNIITDQGRDGIVSSYWDTGGGFTPANIFIYNNIIARNGVLGETDKTRGGIILSSGNDINVQNNVLWNNRPGGEGSRYYQVYSSVIPSALEHDTYYHSSSATPVYYDGASRTLAYMQDTYGFEDDVPSGAVADYGFKDPDGADNTYGTVDDDYRLDGSNIDDGADLGQCFDVFIQGQDYNICTSDALDPSTDWTRFPSPQTIRVADQNNYGDWERGAYAYTGGAAQTYTCTGSIPSDAEAYGPEESTGLAIDTPWTYSADDTAAKCQFRCNSGFAWNAGACIPQHTTETYTILKTQAPPVIDGNINEFTNANSITITNPDKTRGTFRFLWDSRALYVAAEVADTRLNADLSHQEDSSLYSDDSIELFVDTLNNGGASLQSDDYKFYVNINNIHSDSQASGMGWDSGMGSAVIVTGTVNNNADADSGYVIEAMIPWTNFAAPSDDAVWGFDLSMDDKTDAGVIQTAWSNTDGGGFNSPDGWGDAIFSSQLVTPGPTGSMCNSSADADNDGVITISELISSISRWKSGSVPIGSLIDAIGKWKSGC